MSLTSEGGTDTTMLVSPTGLNNGGFGGFGGDGWWIILLFILLGNNGWGNGFGGYGGGEFPWLINGQQGINANTNNGFRDAMINDGINGIRGDINGISTQLCNGFAGVEAGANARQIADMQTAFAGQTAMAQGFNGLQAQLAQCCCDNRLATCQTQNIVQNEGNATRFADANNTRDIIDSQTRGTQAILDKLCALELDAKNDTIAQLRSELMYARGQASQDVQTAAIQAGQRALANEVEQYVLPTPRPAYIVANPNCCTNACGCGV